MTGSLDRRTFPAGTPIFREGEPGGSAYIVERGRVAITALRDGRPVELAVLGVRDIFGEMALVSDSLRSASAIALTDTKVVVVPRDRVLQGMEQADPLLQLLLRVALDRVRSTSQRVVAIQSGAAGRAPVGPSLPAEPTPEVEAARSLAFERLALEDELRTACERGELELWYQPIVGLLDRSIAGFEALLRWRHPERGLLPPSVFIPVAEATGLIGPIGRWVLEEAATALVRLASVETPGTPTAPYLTVNLAARQLADPGIVPQLAEILETTGAPPERLVLEITESELMEQPETAKVHLDRLRDLGCKLFLDDFGTGYSSLSYLHRFPVTGLKLDGSFARSILTDDPVTEKIVRAVALLARELDLGAVAEGIEREEQAAVLGELGFGHGQGFLFSRPQRGMGGERAVEPGEMA